MDKSRAGPLDAGNSASTFSSIPFHEISSMVGGIKFMSFSNRITPSANLFGAHVPEFGPSSQATNFFMSGNSSKVMKERSHHPGDLANVTWCIPG